MRLIYFLVVLGVLGLSFRADAAEKVSRLNCKLVDEGEDIGGRFEIKASFDSKQPSFIDETTITFTGESPRKTTSTYLAPTSVCGLSLNFAKDCKFRERIDHRFGYDFTFTCGSEITSGEVYCDENCLTATGSMATFRCEGPKVDKKLAHPGRMYHGCKIVHTDSILTTKGVSKPR